MELRHIRYFVAVAQELNFTKAAQKLMIAQPPLSRQIKELEEELGVSLFIRNPHKIELTQEGHLYLQYALRVLDLVDKSAEDVKELKNGLSGTIYFASVEGHAPKLFAEWISEFKQQYPNVTYNLWNGNSDDVINRVQKGLCDMAIIVEPHNAEGLDSISVYKEPWIAMIPKDHALAQKEGNTIPLSELSHHDLIIPSRHSRLQEINSWFGGSQHELKVICRIAHMLNAVELTKQGVGITIYPESANIAMDDSICIKQIVEPSVEASYAFVKDKERKLSHAGAAFWKFIEDRYS